MKTKLTTTLCITMLFSVAILSAMLEDSEESSAAEKIEASDLAGDVAGASQVSMSYHIYIEGEDELEIEGKKLLLDAARNGSLEKVKTLLSQRAGIVNCQDVRGRTLLFLVSDQGHLGIVKILPANKADVDQQEDDGCTPLIRASCRGHLEIVKLLLMDKADANRQDYDGHAALIKASSFNHLAIVQLLLKNRADANCQSNNEETALSRAECYRYRNVAKLLRRSGAGY